MVLRAWGLFNKFFLIVAMTALDRGRISVSNGAVGLALACLDASITYANQRVQFGKLIRNINW